MERNSSVLKAMTALNVKSMWSITSMTAESGSLLLNNEATGRRLISRERGQQ